MDSSYPDAKVEIIMHGVVSSVDIYLRYIKLKNKTVTLRLYYPDFMLETIRQYIAQKVTIQASGELDCDGSLCNLFINKITRNELKW